MNRTTLRVESSSNALSIAVGLTALLAAAGATPPPAHAATGPGDVIVTSRFGGMIFGFDIDQNGTEGVLTEAQTLRDGRTLAAVETFDQATGNITKVVQRTLSKDDFITLGVVGHSVGLVEREHVNDLFVDRRIYRTIDPLSANAFTGTWRPPLTKDDIISSVSRLQGTDTTLFVYFENGVSDVVRVLASDVAANTVGIQVTMPGRPFVLANAPAIAYDDVRNQAVVAASKRRWAARRR